MIKVHDSEYYVQLEGPEDLGPGGLVVGEPFIRVYDGFLGQPVLQLNLGTAFGLIEAISKAASGAIYG